MSSYAIQMPDGVEVEELSDQFGRFVIQPLERGYGVTIGNALRRVLLSSLDGYAITSLRIEGVEHEFSTIKGVVEDVTEIVLNLKQIRFKQQIQGLIHGTFDGIFNGRYTVMTGTLLDLGEYIPDSGFRNK